jgi:hypothetical protein
MLLRERDHRTQRTTPLAGSCRPSRSAQATCRGHSAQRAWITPTSPNRGSLSWACVTVLTARREGLWPQKAIPSANQKRQPMKKSVKWVESTDFLRLSCIKQGLSRRGAACCRVVGSSSKWSLEILLRAPFELFSSSHPPSTFGPSGLDEACLSCPDRCVRRGLGAVPGRVSRGPVHW